MVSYGRASRATQVRHLARIARTALGHWDMAEADLRLVHHGYNTTFRVRSATGQRFALRINVNARKQLSHLRAELAWLTALAAETALVVAVPIPTRSGEMFIVVRSSDHERELPVVLFTWLTGRNLGRRATLAQVRAAGRATALLHAHAAGWVLPPGADLPRIDTILRNAPNRLTPDHPALPRDGRSVLAAAMERIQAAYGNLLTRETARPLHADLHGANLRWHRGQLAVFDFDDAGIGVRAQDLAISAYYLRPDDAGEVALLEGYAEVASLPQVTADEFEAVVAGRNLMLANDVIETDNASFRHLTERYLSTTVARMRHFLDTGRYRPDAPGADVF